MGAYILRRILLMIPTLLGIMAINFAVIQFAPGNQCPARGWGVIWLVISLGLWAGGVCYLVLHVGGHLDF